MALFYGNDGDDFFVLPTVLRDIYWGWGGNDYMNGGLGDDIFIKTSGSATVYGGPGHDIMSFWHAPREAHVDMSLGWAYLGDERATPIRMQSIEEVYGSNRGGDTMAGSYHGDTFRGFGNSDTLYGREGNDTLDGGNGADVLHGGTGWNMITGGEGADNFYFADHDTDRFGSDLEISTLTDFDPSEGDTIHLDSDFGIFPAGLDTNGDGGWGPGDETVIAFDDSFLLAPLGYEVGGFFGHTFRELVIGVQGDEPIPLENVTYWDVPEDIFVA